MKSKEFYSKFKKLPLDYVEKIISRYSDYPSDKMIYLNIYFDEKKNKPIKIDINDKDKEEMKKFAQLFHNAYAAYSIFDIENKSFHNLMDKKPSYHEITPSPANKLILDYFSDAKVFLDALENWTKDHLPTNFKNWNNIRKDLYSTSISYRICYNLRNYVQHHMLVPIKSVAVYSNNKEDYVLDGSALTKDSKFLRNTKIDSNFFKDDRNLRVRKHVLYYHRQIHYLFLLSMRKYFGAKCKELMDFHNYFARRNFPHRLYELVTTKKQIITTGTATYFLLDTHDTVSDFLTQLIKWGFVDYGDYKPFIKE